MGVTRRRCRCSKRWCRRFTRHRADGGAARSAVSGVVYVPHGDDHGAVDAGDGGRRLRVHADHEAARAVPGVSCVVVSNLARPEAESTPTTPVRRPRWLTGVPPKRTDGPDFRLGIDDRSGRRETDRPGHDVPVARGGHRRLHRAPRLVRARLQLRVCQHAELAGADDAAADGDQSARRCSSGCSAAATRQTSGGARMREDRSILDFVSEDLADLRGGIGPAIARGSASISTTSARSNGGSSGRSSRRDTTLTVPDAPVGVPESFDEHVGLLFDLLALAYEADLTRVFTFMMARELSQRTYPQHRRHAAASHRCRTTATTRSASRRTPRSTPTTSQLFAQVPGAAARDAGRRRLAARPLDDSLRQRHGQRQRPRRRSAAAVSSVAAGSIKGNRHVVAPQHIPNANLLLSMADKFGVEMDTFGVSTARVDL